MVALLHVEGVWSNLLVLLGRIVDHGASDPGVGILALLETGTGVQISMSHGGASDGGYDFAVVLG